MGHARRLVSYDFDRRPADHILLRGREPGLYIYKDAAWSAQASDDDLCRNCSSHSMTLSNHASRSSISSLVYWLESSEDRDPWDLRFIRIMTPFQRWHECRDRLSVFIMESQRWSSIPVVALRSLCIRGSCAALCQFLPLSL